MPTVTKNLLIINVLVFLAGYVLKGYGVNLNNMFGLHFILASDFRIYQLFTYMFLHGGFEHIFFNMLPCGCSDVFLNMCGGRSVSSFTTLCVEWERAFVRS